MTIQKRVSKKGVVSYLIRVSLGYNGGQQIIKSMTYKPEKGMTPKQIEKEVNRQAVLFEEQTKQKYKAQLKREADQQEQEENEIAYAKKHYTFKKVAEDWLTLQEDSRNLKPSSLLRMKDCRERTYNAFGDVLIVNITHKRVQNFITSLGKVGANKKTGQGLSQKTQKHYLTFVSDVMIYALNCGYVDNSPCKDITFTKNDKDNKEKDFYSLDEAKAVLSLIDEKAPTDYKLFFNLLAYSGMRRGEALGLEYKDIDFANSFLSISRTSNYRSGSGTYTDTPKTEAGYRSIAIEPKIIALINQLHAEQLQQAKKCGDLWVDTDRLFITWCGKPMHPNTPYTWLQRFCEQENVSFKGLHSFRHFFISYSIANGVDEKEVSVTAGHATLQSTARYRHTTEKLNKNAVSCIANLLETA